MAKEPTTFSNLPPEIIFHILPHLEVRDFLNLTASNKDLYTKYINEAGFWTRATRKTFRVANQPVVERDGERWRKLYKRLMTQTKAYGWGENGHNCLSQPIYTDGTAQGIMHRRRMMNISWPKKMLHTGSIGIISDMQCGGWSTSLLTSNGALRISGVLDGGDITQGSTTFNSILRYPTGFTQPVEQYHEATAVMQYSQGRSHLLALSDSRRIWSWRNADCAAISIRFVLHETNERQHDGRGTVEKVVAGWSKSAALIVGSGIVVWDPIGRQHDEPEITDAALVLESAVVPYTNGLPGESTEIGHVVNFIVLEQLIVFNTNTGKAYVSAIIWTDRQQRLETPVEIPGPEDVTDVQGTFRNLAVFTNSGAVLTTSQDRLIRCVLRTPRSTGPIFDQIPALQKNQVIALAFGDYHFHALHAPGYITSYGKEPQSCGALGLGGNATPESRLRGMRHEGAQMPIRFDLRVHGDATLVPHARLSGRRVWFEQEKREWIRFLTSGGADAEEARERMRMTLGSPDYHAQGEVSEWIEQEGRDWEDKYHVRREGDDDLPAYFVMSICAAGWHSGALVLVNEDLADRITNAVELKEFEDQTLPQNSQAPSGLLELLVSFLWLLYDVGHWFLATGPYAHLQQPRFLDQTINGSLQSTDPVSFGASPRAGYRYAWADDHFPRLKLRNGEVMPGKAPLNEWRYEQPQWDEDI